MKRALARKQTPEILPVPDEFYTDLPVGEILRRARLQRGMPIDQAERQLHIRAGHLAALERSDFNALPGRVYVIGFIRTYAEFLGLDGDRVVHLLKRQSRGLGTPQSLNMHYLPSDNRLPSVPILAAAAAGILILLTVWVAYQSTRMGMAPSLPSAPMDTQSLRALEEQAAQAVADVGGDVSPVVPVPAALKGVIDRAASGKAAAMGPSSADLPSAPIVIDIVDDSWVELRAPNGRVVQARLFRAGEVITLDAPVDAAGNAYRLSVGNAAGVRLVVKGKVLPPLGAPETVRRNISLDPAGFYP